jgi:hypothetical protein
MKKIIVFGSCQTGGLELWHEKHVPNFKNFSTVSAALNTKFNEGYIKVVQNKKQSELAKEQIEYCQTNSWPSQLKSKYPDAEILNFAVPQGNISTFIKLSAYLDSLQLSKNETKIIIEIMDPVGITRVCENMLRSYDKDALEYYLSKEESAKMQEYLNVYEPLRYRAYLEIMTAKNAISDLKLKGFDVSYFIRDRKQWYSVLDHTQPFEMFIEYGNHITDNFDMLFSEFLKDSLLTEEQDLELNNLPLLPQGHFSNEAHMLLGKFICNNLK